MSETIKNHGQRIRKPAYIKAEDFERIKAAIKSGKGEDHPPIHISRRTKIASYMIGYKFLVGNGSKNKKVITPHAGMIGQSFGAFYATRTFTGHAKGEK